MAVTYFGITPNGNDAQTRTANNIWAQKFQNTALTGIITELGVKFYNVGNSVNVRIGVYADSAGVPGGLLLDAGVIVQASGWVSKTGLSLPVTLNDYYWLVFLAEADATYWMLTSQTAADIAVHSETYGALPNPYGTRSAYGTSKVVMRAGVEAGGATNIVYMLFES